MLNETKVTLIGNLGKYPNYSFLSNGTEVMKFSIATNSKKKVGGEEENFPTWHNISVFNKKYISIAKENLKKGDLVLIEDASFSYSSYENIHGEKVKDVSIKIDENQGRLFLLQNLNRKSSEEKVSEKYEKKYASLDVTASNETVSISKPV